MTPHNSMVDGNSEIGAHVGSNLCHLICLKHLINSRAVIGFFSLQIFLHACATCSKLPSNTSTMDSTAIENWSPPFSNWERH